MKKQITTRVEAPKWEIGFWSNDGFSHQKFEKILLEGMDLPYVLAEYFQATYPQYTINPNDFELIKEAQGFKSYKTTKLWMKELSVTASLLENKE